MTATANGIRVLDGRATFEQLLHNVVANLIAGGIVGAVAGRLGGMPPGDPPPPSGGSPPASGGPPAQNVLVVGAETAGEFAWASEVAATGQQVTVVNPVITPEAQTYAARAAQWGRGACGHRAVVRAVPSARHRRPARRACRRIAARR